jgi:hypothetical protein
VVVKDNGQLEVHEDVYTVAGTGDAHVPMIDNDAGNGVSFNHCMGLAVDAMGNM